MATWQATPFDVLDIIADKLNQHQYKNTLKSGSLVCHAWTAPFQIRLFLHINNPRLFPKNSAHLATYARRLSILKASCYLSQRFPTVLGQFKSINTLHLSAIGDWRKLSPDLQYSLRLLLHSPSIHSISLADTRNLPLDLVRPSCELRSLALRRCSFVSSTPVVDTIASQEPLEKATVSSLTMDEHSFLPFCAWMRSPGCTLDLGQLVKLSLDGASFDNNNGPSLNALGSLKCLQSLNMVLRRSQIDPNRGGAHFFFDFSLLPRLQTMTIGFWNIDDLSHHLTMLLHTFQTLKHPRQNHNKLDFQICVVRFSIESFDAVWVQIFALLSTSLWLNSLGPSKIVMPKSYSPLKSQDVGAFKENWPALHSTRLLTLQPA